MENDLQVYVAQLKRGNYLKIALVLLLLFVAGMIIFKKDIQVITPPKAKTVVNNIYNKEKQIETIEKSLIPDNKQIRALSLTIDELMQEVEVLKHKRDTAILVETQDTLICVLYHQGLVKDTVIQKQSLIIQDLKYISSSKDTLLLIANAKYKKAKRRNIVLGAIAGAGILGTTIAIIK